MTLNTTRSKVPHTSVTSVAESQIPFFSTTSLFRVTGHYETSALNGKVTLNTTRPKVAHICYYCPESQISVRFALRPAMFELQAILRQTIAPNDPKWQNITRSKVHHICFTNVPVSQVHPPFSSTTNHFRDTNLAIIGNAPNDLRMTLNT